mgnify:FL=1
MMRRSLALLLAATLLAGLLTACSKEEKEPETACSTAPVTIEVRTTAAELMSGEHFAVEQASGWEGGGSQNAVKQKNSTAQMDIVTLGSLEANPVAYLQKFHDTYRDGGLGKNLSDVETVSIGGMGAAYFQFEDTVAKEGTVKAFYCLNQNQKTYLITCWAVGWKDFNAADFPALIGQIQFR